MGSPPLPVKPPLVVNMVAPRRWTPLVAHPKPVPKTVVDLVSPAPARWQKMTTQELAITDQNSEELVPTSALITWNGEFGWGDCYGGTCYGFGLMQIDRRYHSKKGAWDSQQHIEQATDILIDTINCVARKHTSWKLEQKTKGGISGYNAGCGNVQTYDGMDIGTTGNDYSSDVVSRANYYRDSGL